MNETGYKLEDEARPFAVRDYLDRPEVIEAYIGDLQVKIDRLLVSLDGIAEQIWRTAQQNR